ncbi:hypothetical protein F4779DRAFT_625316 [Xylariaceae sp. FL0662B]|nr:hypothetical protein F4779DRAFT_625316 [Xylariaceae sp. FL0662B]
MDHTGQAAGFDPADHLRSPWQAKPIRRRNRMINSCLECRRRKLKCSKTSPSCTNCVKAARECLYIGPRLDEASQMRLAEIKEKQGTLERQLERDVAKSTSSKSTQQQRILADEVGNDDDEQRDLEATPLVALDLTYDDDADGTEDMIDLGIQIGKMRITERIGGLSRPRISEEISTGISANQQPSDQLSQHGGRIPGPDDLSDGMNGSSLPDFLRPGAQYIVPTSGFFFGQIGESPSILQFLPFRAAADRLIKQYLVAVHPIAPCTHRPSLETIYATFWEEITAGFEPRPSIQAIIFAAMFSGAISMDENDIVRELSVYPKDNWVASLKMGTETALSKANFLRTTRVETMQAFIMYMLPLCRAEVSRAHSVLVGAAVRMAECMGLHRDGEAYGLTPLETHVRRLIWHQLCFLDIRTCEAQGPKPVIRRDDYDTKLPLNCNEEELTHAVAPPESVDVWTTNTLALIRFEINEMMRAIWLDRRRLETHKLTLTAALTKIENFRRRMSEKYDHLLDVTQPIQRYAKCVMYLLMYRLHVMILHPYHSNAVNAMPARLNQLLITSGVMIVELAIQLETNSVFRDWAWYLGAYFQYQIALLLATEVYFRPHAGEADRIWTCLDYVFGLDRRLPPEAKGIQVLSEIQNKTAVYMRMRKMRGPTSLARAMPGQNVLAGTGPAASSSSATAAAAQQNPFQQPAAAAAVEAMQQQGGVPKIERGNTPPFQAAQHVAAMARPPLLPPRSQMVFAGVSDSQALWSLPPNHHGSPGSSDASSSVGGPGPGSGPPPAQGGGGGGGASSSGLVQGTNIMDNIDWDTVNALFPQDPQTGGLSIQGFHDASFGVQNWNT